MLRSSSTETSLDGEALSGLLDGVYCFHSQSVGQWLWLQIQTLLPSPGISDMANAVGDAGDKVPDPEVQGAAGVAKGAAAFTKMASSLMKTFSQLRMVHMCGLSTYEHERHRLVSSAVVRAHFPPSRVRLFSFPLIYRRPFDPQVEELQLK